MIHNLSIGFILFIIYSFIGWLMEVTNCLWEKHRFINRGFLIGPICPIYGVGSVLLITLLTRYSDNLLRLFLHAIIICSLLEYFTSFIMEKIFHARWWDYSKKKYNLNDQSLNTSQEKDFQIIESYCYLSGQKEDENNHFENSQTNFNKNNTIKEKESKIENNQAQELHNHVQKILDEFN